MTEGMFKPVDIDEKTLLAGTDRKKKGQDFSIRTVTHWIHLQHHMAYCTVPSHYENVPSTDMSGNPYDKYPNRMCVLIEPYEACRHCYIAEADNVAREDKLPPTVLTDEQKAELDASRN